MRTRFITVIWFIALLSCQVKAQSLADAVLYLQQRNYVATIEACNEFLQTAPTDVDALSMRSIAYTGINKYDLALKDADQAVGISQASGIAHFARGEVYFYGKKDYNLALKEYDLAIQSKSEMPEAYAGKIRAYIAMQNTKEAAKVTDEAIRKYPSNAELYFLRGQQDFQKGKPKLAVESYDEALSADPKWNTSQVYLSRGLANEALLLYELAVQDYSKSIATDPNNSVAYFSRGNIKYLLEQYEESAQDFKKAEILNPDNQVITYNIAMAYHRNGDRSNACKYFQKSCSQGNNNACKMVLLNCTDRKIN